MTKLADIAVHGEESEVRGSLTRELCHQTVILENPLERCVIVPNRRNNIFATIAETVWVMAGRNDLDFLSHYLPRSADFSDDGGVTWRAGYGPRLRSWKGTVDQVAEVLKLLSTSESSRRAVMSLFDPEQDYQESNDIPCTNWLHFTVRDGYLNMSITVRSNDLMWGFSGINTFEWSVLQEMVAHWLGKKVGTATFFISSLHLYARHFNRASEILSAPHFHDPYRLTPATSRFQTSFDDLPQCLQLWFHLEKEIRTGSLSGTGRTSSGDPLLDDFLAMLKAYWAFHAGRTAEARALLAEVTDSVMAEAGLTYFEWKAMTPAPQGDTERITVTPLTENELNEYLNRRTPPTTAGGSPNCRSSTRRLLTNATNRLQLAESSAVFELFEAAADVITLTRKLKESSQLDPTNVHQNAGDTPAKDRPGSATPRQAAHPENLRTALDALQEEGFLERGYQWTDKDHASDLTALEKLSVRARHLLLALCQQHPVQTRHLTREISTAPS
ncbi:thymidylate synthase [Pseudarthrobacter sp. NPDC092439]|uniref:thymidylate synthase n=1 Tax=unclassified Pseudarthrobacter TaxID=2647000 RepID=UPI00381323D0